MGRRKIALLLIAFAVIVPAGVLAQRATAQIETPIPTVVPEFVTPAPTLAPVITAPPPVQTAFPTIPPINVGAAAGIGIFFILIWLAVAAFFIIVMWRIFTKAGEPGWASLIPIYNAIVLLKIAGRPWWWIFIFWLIIPAIIVYIDLAHRFGQSTGFGVGMILLPPIFFAILAFGSAEYEPATAAG